MNGLPCHRSTLIYFDLGSQNRGCSEVKYGVAHEKQVCTDDEQDAESIARVQVQARLRTNRLLIVQEPLLDEAYPVSRVDGYGSSH